MKEVNYIRHEPMVRRSEREKPKPTAEELARRWESLAARRYVHEAGANAEIEEIEMAPHYLAQQIERLDIRILEELRAIVMRINLRDYALTEDEAMDLAEKLRAAAWQIGAAKHGRGES